MIIYLTTNTVNNKIYVGQSVYDRPTYMGSGKLLIAAMHKYGYSNFTKTILQRCSSIEELNAAEKYWIAELKSQDKSIGYNILAGGCDFDFSNSQDYEEIKQSRRKKLHEHYQNPENAAALGVAIKAQYETRTAEEKLERRRKISATRQSRDYTDANRRTLETKANKSDEEKIKLRKLNSVASARRSKYTVICKQSGIVYPTLKIAAETIELRRVDLYDMLVNKKKQNTTSFELHSIGFNKQEKTYL